MATRTVSQKTIVYGIIRRGNSLTIPVILKDVEDKPIDLTGTSISFTVKKVRSDFDRDDSQAYIKKDFEPQEPTNGQFYVILSSEDTDFEPGAFFFDIEIIKQDIGMVYRLCTLEFELVGGPTNRNINNGIGQMPIGDQITIVTLPQGNPIVIIAPTLSLSSQIYDKIITLEETIENQNSKIIELTEQLETFKENLDEWETLINEQLENSTISINYDYDGDIPRPMGASRVLWSGYVEPLNALPNDIFFDKNEVS